MLINTEILSLLEKNAIKESVITKDSFISNIFMFPKKGGEHRAVINLKGHFKMEGIHFLKDILVRNDWMLKIDLKQA